MLKIFTFERWSISHGLEFQIPLTLSVEIKVNLPSLLPSPFPSVLLLKFICHFDDFSPFPPDFPITVFQLQFRVIVKTPRKGTLQEDSYSPMSLLIAGHCGRPSLSDEFYYLSRLLKILCLTVHIDWIQSHRT